MHPFTPYHLQPPPPQPDDDSSLYSSSSSSSVSASPSPSPPPPHHHHQNRHSSSATDSHSSSASSHSTHVSSESSAAPHPPRRLDPATAMPMLEETRSGTVIGIASRRGRGSGSGRVPGGWCCRRRGFVLCLGWMWGGWRGSGGVCGRVGDRRRWLLWLLVVLVL